MTIPIPIVKEIHAVSSKLFLVETTMPLTERGARACVFKGAVFFFVFFLNRQYYIQYYLSRTLSDRKHTCYDKKQSVSTRAVVAEVEGGKTRVH